VHLGQAHHPHIHASVQQCRARAFRGDARVAMARIEHGFQRRLAARDLPHADAGGDQQRTRRTPQFLAQRTDHSGILLAVGGETAEIMVKGGVDHRIGRRRTSAKTGQVAQVATLHLGTCSAQRLRTRFRTAQANDFVACCLQLLAYAAAYEAGGTGQEHTHGIPLRWKVGPVSSRIDPVKVVTLYRYSY